MDMQEELERAYRCISGLYVSIQKGRLPPDDVLAYQSPVIGAARRFVVEGQLDGSKYFDGKSVDVLHAALKL